MRAKQLLHSRSPNGFFVVYGESRHIPACNPYGILAYDDFFLASELFGELPTLIYFQLPFLFSFAAGFMTAELGL